MKFGRRPAPLELGGASVAITGGAGGIGRAIAEHFARAGARVAIGDLDAQQAKETAAEIGSGAIGIGLDVTDEASFGAFLDAAEWSNGPIDIVVNNAGVDWMGQFHSGKDSTSRRELAVNLMGPIIGSRLALQRMLPRDRGHIVNVASAAGRVPQPGSAVYTATKHGVVGLTECLALEYRDTGIRFSLLHPGYIQTRMTEGTQRPSALVPAATPDDCARAVVKAVQHNRFNIWAPAGQWVGIKLGQILGRAIRDRVLISIRIGKIAENVDTTARREYYEKAFGGGSHDHQHHA
ncbi:SDR family NAD(P)-dependent oxidoreductase [Nocardia sp. NPDC047038]|uniref:SDR family NAD(P)-dependent oxidoreductase n=1 Tax=Nocardia sp. NPDC047038 TaxID=3154338 RepID=UPI0033E8D649